LIWESVGCDVSWLSPLKSIAISGAKILKVFKRDPKKVQDRSFRVRWGLLRLLYIYFSTRAKERPPNPSCQKDYVVSKKTWKILSTLQGFQLRTIILGTVVRSIISVIAVPLSSSCKPSQEMHGWIESHAGTFVVHLETVPRCSCVSVPDVSWGRGPL